jgi:hypothetical protein
MKVLDKLKTFFEGKFGDIFANNTIKLFDFSKNTSQVLELKDGQRLSLDLSKATPQEKEYIKTNVIDSVIQEDNETFLTKESTSKAIQIKENLPEDDDVVLRFYRGKVSPELFRALEAALVVKNAYEKGGDISELKRDINSRYPDFGNNLCNLVTRGYFNDYFPKLYFEMLGQEHFSIIDYQEEVERIVRSLPYMVFVSRTTSLQELQFEVKMKLDRLRKYGTEKLKLHGLGRDNVSKTLAVLRDYNSESSLNIQNFANPSGTIITSVIRFVKE